MSPAATEVRYVCSGCKQSVQVFIPATVRCSRCGCPMQAMADGATADVAATAHGQG